MAVGRTVHSATFGIGSDSSEPDFIIRREAQLLISYADSPIVASGAGGRAPDAGGLPRAAVSDPFRLFGIFGRDHTLLLYAGPEAGTETVPELEAAAAAAMRAAHGRLGVYVIAAPQAGVQATVLPLIRDAAGEFARAYRVTGTGAFVVRPDGYLGYARTEIHPEAVVRHMTHTFA